MAATPTSYYNMTPEAKRQCQDLYIAHSRLSLRHAKKNLNDLLTHKQFSQNFEKSEPVLVNGGILVYLGDRGTGKTQMAAEYIRIVTMMRRTALYYRCREIGMKLREAYDIKGDLTELAAVNIFVKPWLLVIDECQEKPDRDWESRTLTLLIDRRYAEVKPTIMIANCDDKQFLDLMGPGIYDRIKEGGGALLFDWKSFRANLTVSP
jgi:DNA replication protein DnaC